MKDFDKLGLRIFAAILPILLLLTGFLAFPASAANIEGRIYDYALSPVQQGIVEIDTIPVQRFQRYVIINGSYSFEVPIGNYTIRAQSVRNGIIRANATQTIAVSEQGTFNLDLILLPVIDEPSLDEDLDVSDVASALSDPPNASWPDLPLWAAITAITAATAASFLLFRRKSKTMQSYNGMPSRDRVSSHDSQSIEGRHDLEALIRALRARDGRSTQRELRKDLPFSEAKVSLMISELEHEGRIEKIRKGRGNIIIFKG